MSEKQRDGAWTERIEDTSAGPGKHPLYRAIAAMQTSPWRVALACLAGSAALACAIALIGTSGWLISRAAQHPPVLYLMVAVVAVRTFGIGRGVLRYAERLASHDVALRGVVTLRTTLYARLAAADPAVAAGLRRGDLLARIGADVDAIGDVVVRSLLPFATAALTALLSVVAISLVLPEAGAVLGVAVLIAGIAAPGLAGLAARRDLRDAASARSAMSGEVLGLLDGLGELSIAKAVAERQHRLALADQDLDRALDRAARPAAWAAALSMTAMGGAVVGCLAVGVSAVADGRLRPVFLAVVTLVPLAVAEVVSGLPAAATVLVRARAAADRVVALLDAAPMDPGSDPPIGPNQGRFQAPTGNRSRPHLRAQALACGWAGRPPVLHGVDLDLPAGRRVAVVGPSGGGKSTLLLTLAGLLPASAGRVSLDGTDLTELDPGLIRRSVHLCSDDAHVFITTVRENLRVAAPGADDTDLRRVLCRAGLSGWLSALPAGLDTMIGDPSGPGAHLGGWPLSGGERRRLLIARALLTEAGILLIDEPAEHLDPQTADALVEELFAAGRSVVVVTHRISALHSADEVLVVDDGRITARGRHEELLSTHPPYRDAWLAERGEPLSAVPR
jgi:ATP-binding cassette, subfamily C, bacterial CydC